MPSDHENPEWTEADFAAAQGPESLPLELAAAFPKTKTGRPIGRPVGSVRSTKARITLRLDDDVLAKFKATGPGWQSRINDALRRAKA